MKKKFTTDALENVVRYLNPGGYIVIQGSLGEHCYSVGSSMFPAMTADEDLIFDIFKESQLQIIKWQLSNNGLTTHYFSLLRK